ncbi:hypothetical protein [Streptomyces sp. ADI93-02]|uniref:hypothetical protein n=1 Tax=Streptomyces sp. ADI93-02 TaxID=1522757 RepID=UPI000F54CDE3|nr:hypothetical protein [Streptomyces sp. ADI93-02]RPK49592.1 hypothetical protein EES40_07420 [Streptomyces sp. ADI93-02]
MHRTKVRNTAAVLLTVTAAAAGAAYLLNIPPFEGVGTIEASDVCENLGTSAKVAPALQELAPRKPEYSFREQKDLRDAINYFSGCHAWTGNREFLVTRTEYTHLGDTFDEWAGGPASKMIDIEDPKKFNRFDIGTNGWGVVSQRKAALSTPCFAEKKKSLTTIVVLWDTAEGRTNNRYRQELIDLATSAAKYAHEDARCTIPFEI